MFHFRPLRCKLSGKVSIQIEIRNFQTKLSMKVSWPMANGGYLTHYFVKLWFQKSAWHRLGADFGLRHTLQGFSIFQA